MQKEVHSCGPREKCPCAAEPEDLTTFFSWLTFPDRRSNSLIAPGKVWERFG
jgi:hypothetical protein